MNIKIKINSIKLNIFFTVLIVHTCLDAWLQETVLFTMGPMNFYVIDLMYLLLMYVVARVLLSNYSIKTIATEPFYLLFLLWILIEVIVGYTRYGFRALGETRLVSNFVSFFIPYYLLSKKQQGNTVYIMTLIFKTIYCCAVASLLVYVLKANLGYETVKDFRGIRYIGSTQTFNITLLICFYAFKYTFSNVLSFKEAMLLILSFAIAILSKNRAGLIFPSAMAFFVYARYTRVKMLTYGILIVVLFILAVKSFTPDTVLTEVDTAFSGAIDPANDQTGKWRLAIQMVALNQAFETFWFGQGYGSYFNLVVAEQYRNILYEVSPHNQFLVIFMKTGLIGILLLTSLLIVYIYKSYNILNEIPNKTNEKIYILLLLVIVSSQLFYGMVYEFIPFFGLYYGFGALLIRSIKLNTVITDVHANTPL